MARQNAETLLETAARRRAEAAALEAQAEVLQAADDRSGKLMVSISAIERASTSLMKLMSSASGDSSAVIEALDTLRDGGRDLSAEAKRLSSQYSRRVGKIEASTKPRTRTGRTPAGRSPTGRAQTLPPLPENVAVLDNPETLVAEFSRLAEHSEPTVKTNRQSWMRHVRLCAEQDVSPIDTPADDRMGDTAGARANRIRAWATAARDRAAAGSDPQDGDTGDVSAEASPGDSADAERADTAEHAEAEEAVAEATEAEEPAETVKAADVSEPAAEPAAETAATDAAVPETEEPAQTEAAAAEPEPAPAAVPEPEPVAADAAAEVHDPAPAVPEQTAAPVPEPAAETAPEPAPEPVQPAEQAAEQVVQQPAEQPVEQPAEPAAAPAAEPAAGNGQSENPAADITVALQQVADNAAEVPPLRIAALACLAGLEPPEAVALRHSQVTVDPANPEDSVIVASAFASFAVPRSSYDDLRAWQGEHSGPDSFLLAQNGVPFTVDDIGPELSNAMQRSIAQTPAEPDTAQA